MISQCSSADLRAFAKGNLSEPARAKLSAHLRVCPACRDMVRAFEEAEGLALAEETSAPMREGALERCLALIDQMPSAEDRADVWWAGFPRQ